MKNSNEIHVSGLRTEQDGEWTKLIVNITYRGGGHTVFDHENTMWIAVKNENADMLASDVYDAFVLLPLYLGMYYKADLYIHGAMSKKLYKNIMNYLQRILCDFSGDLSRIDVHAEGFREAEGRQGIIGAGISCGVDSLSTIYDRYLHEDDQEYKINGLFFFNVGWHGDYHDERTERLFFERYKLVRPLADELGLPVYVVRTNYHAFAYGIYGNNYPGGHMGYFANYSCVLGLGRAVKKYYVASGRSYEEIKKFSRIEEHDTDLSGFADSYLVPLVRTEHLEFIMDGCQYDRPQKIENIADWELAQKYLNVCVVKADGIDDAHNCSSCNKCTMTLLVLEALGKLNNYAGVFDLETYRRISFRNKCSRVLAQHSKCHSADVCNFALRKGMRLPSKLAALIYLFLSSPSGFIKKLFRKLAGGTARQTLKR